MYILLLKKSKKNFVTVRQSNVSYPFELPHYGCYFVTETTHIINFVSRFFVSQNLLINHTKILGLQFCDTFHKFMKFWLSMLEHRGITLFTVWF